MSVKTGNDEIEQRNRDTYMEYYYHLHKNPEPSYEEKETAEYIALKLKELPLDEVKTGVGGHGVTALLKGGKPGPVIALRADIDALNVQEATGAAFESTKPGIMHACGHDAHTAILLGTARVLCEMKNQLAGTVKFIFQPSEEMTPRGGALGMIEDGALKNPNVDAMIALHVWPQFKTGEIGVQDGIVSAASDHIKITIKGKSAHASMPHEGTDAILAASTVASSLQSIVSRNIDPRETAVVTIGVIRGGARYNVIADEVFLEGTVRTFNPAVTRVMPEMIRRVAENTAAAFGARADIEYESGYPSVVNDPGVSEICRKAVAEIVGKEGLLPVQLVPAAGEDFSFFAREVPAAFAWLGCRREGASAQDAPPLHNAGFLPDPQALPLGVKYFVASVLKLLEEYRK